MNRVLHIVNGMNRGGLETFIMNVYRNIDREKVQFDFLVHTDKKCAFDDEIRTLGGKIFYIPPRNKGFIKNQKALYKFFETHPEYKIVHQHLSSLSYIEPLKVANKFRIPIRIVHGHSTQEGGNPLHKYFHKWHQKSIKKIATHYFACSDLAAKWLFGEKQYGSGEYKIIFNGINTDDFSYDSKTREKVRAKFNLKNKYVIGHIGRFTYAKNHEFLISLFKYIYEYDNETILLLVGDGETRKEIECQISSLGLNDSVILTGVREDIPELLQAMDVFVFPSIYEGLPVSLVEAQASGLPCLVSDRITRQVEITKAIEYIDLSSPISYWANKIAELKRNYVRKDQSRQVADAGFDIKKTSLELQQIYLDSKGTLK